MTARVHSRRPVRTLLEFGRCAEGSIVCEPTFRKLCGRACDTPGTEEPRTIPRRSRDTSGKSQTNRTQRGSRVEHPPRRVRQTLRLLRSGNERPELSITELSYRIGSTKGRSDPGNPLDSSPASQINFGGIP